VTFSGIAEPAALAAAARRLMAIRPHRDAGPDGVTVITDTRANDAGYAAFTDAELIPHTDGSSVPDAVSRYAQREWWTGAPHHHSLSAN